MIEEIEKVLKYLEQYYKNTLDGVDEDGDMLFREDILLRQGFCEGIAYTLRLLGYKKEVDEVIWGLNNDYKRHLVL